MNGTLENGTDSTILFLSITDVATHLILVVPSNIYVLWLILSGAGGTIASEFFYLNLTASLIIDTMSSIFNLASVLTLNYTLFMASNIVSIVFFWFAVPLFQCCVCVERYIAVVHPVVYLRSKALRYRVACCCAVWLMAIAPSPFVLWSWSKTVMPYVFLGFCVVCISVLLFCCLSVLRALKQPGPGEGQRDNGIDMKRRAFRIILVSLVVMVLTIMSYLPHILCGLLYQQCSQVAGLITFILSRVSGFAHPLLYIHKVGKLPCFKGL